MVAVPFVPEVKLAKELVAPVGANQLGATPGPLDCNTYPAFPGVNAAIPLVSFPYKTPSAVKLVCPVPPLATGKVLVTSEELRLTSLEVILPVLSLCKIPAPYDEN